VIRRQSTLLSEAANRIHCGSAHMQPKIRIAHRSTRGSPSTPAESIQADSHSSGNPGIQRSSPRAIHDLREVQRAIESTVSVVEPAM